MMNQLDHMHTQLMVKPDPAPWSDGDRPNDSKCELQPVMLYYIDIVVHILTFCCASIRNSRKQLLQLCHRYICTF